MARPVDGRHYSDRAAYQAALRKKFSKTREESRTEYESRVETVRVPSRYGRIVRNTSIGVLAVFLIVLGAYFGKELLNDVKSKRNVEALQTFVASSEAPTLSVTEIKDLTSAPETVAVEGELSVPPLQEIPADRLTSYWALYEENPDFCGWLTIADTPVDYPVMHCADDNDFYLSHNFYGEADVNGLLVLDKRCVRSGEENHLLIHGHNMKSGFLFGSLKNYKDPDYCAAHPYLIYDSLYGRRTYEVFAVFLSSVDLADTADFHYYDYIDIGSEEDFTTYVNTARQQSLYPLEVPVQYGDYLLTLSTCDYSKENGRLVIVARCAVGEDH